MPRFRRTLVAILLLGLVLLGTGCVYIRLLSLKAQIAQLHENFRIDTAEGLTIDFIHPILLEDDMRAIGLPPSQIAGEPENRVWTYVFKKRYPSGGSEPRSYDVVVTAHFQDQRLSRVSVAEEHFQALPKSFPIELFHSVGRASVEVLKRRVLARPSQFAWAPGKEPTFSSITMETIASALGEPYSRTTEDGKTTCRYRYLLRPIEAGASTRRYSVTFVFDADNTLEAIHGILPSAGKITFR